ncbi:hypothetical protein CC1G_02879 [Coprinopsis cinerea okayama7|uniref:E3 ubiquitin-protein ligase n=1 Tax=Coprinopsis cinerea (strain Okayama-7 / 130 / ATCC MYA-4618 / FGSC 9003) TaxID=240176 RepID=A8MZY3_COPC7|nr:hypothetical protein CC1G_02879 [Coprinopsis cinerea okayama7\|eukprot:XP_001828298.2 hypothetical protein CC1G_02879 [Coprinopsis cinerea okayama7\
MAHRLSQDPRGDPLSDLRFSLEIMPGSRKYVFTPAARAEILTKLYASLMGSGGNQKYFLPKGVNNVPQHQLLSEYQASVGFSGAGKDDDQIVPGRPCGHIFKKGESCYRCKDCALDDSCVLCARCFHAADHTDHSVSFFIAQQPGGCCDCGDEEAWRRNPNCKLHPYTTSTAPLTIPAGPLSNDLPPVSPLLQNLPQALKDSMHRTIGYALDFLLDTLDFSPDEITVPLNEADLRLQPSADPMMKDVYCVVLWNGDKHTFDEVKTVILDLTGKGHSPERVKEVEGMVKTLESDGRVVVDMNVVNTSQPLSAGPHGGQPQQAKLLDMAHSMAQIDLGVTIRRAYDTFCEQVGAVIIEWLLDLTRARLGPDTMALKEVLAKELMMPRRRDAFTLGMAGLSKAPGGMALPTSAVNLTEIPNATRIDYMFVYHSRLWKKLRLSLKEVYASLLSLSKTHKFSIAGHFANTYHRITDTYLLTDREAETSIKYFALQLFTVPSISAHLVKNHKIITNLLNLLACFFTNQINRPGKRVVVPIGGQSQQNALTNMPYFPVTGGGVLFGAPPPTATAGGSTSAPPTLPFPLTGHPPGHPGFHQQPAAHQALQHMPHQPVMDVDSFPFKSKRFMPIFSDLRYLMHTAPVQALLTEPSNIIVTNGQPQITGHLAYLVPFTQTCQLFMCAQSNRRAVNVHVEYESDAWISVFNVTLSLSRVIKVVGGAYANTSNTVQLVVEGDPKPLVAPRGPREVVEALEVVITCLIGVCRSNGGDVPVAKDPPLLLAALHRGHQPGYNQNYYFNPAFLAMDKSKFGTIKYHNVVFGAGFKDEETRARTKTYEVVRFDVAEGWVSFHHSLHWLLAELFKSTHLLSEEKLREEFGGTEFDEYRSVRDVVLRCAGGEKAVLAIIDFPLRVLAMVAQIRVGLWVRNGFAIRGQLMHYRDYMLRELCFDQDLFMLQSALILLDPDIVLVTILDRFNLMAYFNGVAMDESDEEDGEEDISGAMDEDGKEGKPGKTSPYNTNYEDISHLCGMVEELLFVLITMVSENAAASRMPVPSAVRREIVHALAMGPCGFSELTKRVAERFGDNIAFERILREVAMFKPPEGATDVGVYELKEDVLFEEVNPFFFHYTRNRREEVENMLRAKTKKRFAKEGKGDQEWVYVPKKFGVTEGPYKDIPRVFESEVFLQILFYTVYNVLVLTESSGGQAAPAAAPAGSGQSNGGTGGTGGASGNGGAAPPSASGTPPSAEAILDQVLHLIMLGLVEREETLSKLAASKTFEEDRTLVDVVCALEYHDQYKNYRARVQWILDRMAKHAPDAVKERRKAYDSLKPAVDPEEARKKAAKARQEAIMQQMKAQQNQFAINFDDLDDEDDEGSAMSVDEENGEEVETEISFGTCIVCQEDLSTGGKSFGALGLVQPSRFIRRHPDSSHHTYLNEVLGMVTNLDRAAAPPTHHTFPPPNADVLDAKSTNTTQNFEGFPASYTRFGLVTSVCSHMMHLECFQVYSVSIRQRHRAQATRNHPESIPRKEYICPLCKSLGNVILPVVNPSRVKMNTTPFADWIRAAGINILKSKPDPHLDSLQIRNGTGEFVFWAAQDPGYSSAVRGNNGEGKPEVLEAAKMVDTVMVVSKSFSQQTRHLRDRPEPDPGERGAGLYLPEELLGYTIAQIESAQRGVEVPGGGLIADNLSESQTRMIRGIVSILGRLVALQFKGRPDEGRDAVRQAIVKRLLPEWSRTSLTSYHIPLLLRDPFTILAEAAAVAPDILKHVLILTYYACLARSVVGLVYILNKTRSYSITQIPRRAHEEIFGDVRMFFMSVVRHSPVFEHTATLAFETFGEARMEKLLYSFTLPFLRRAAILCRSVLPSAFPTPTFGSNQPCEYTRLLKMLGIPPLSELPAHDTLQNALSGWCAHYGHMVTLSQMNCGVLLDFPGIYKLARLPLVLDTMFMLPEKVLTCNRCNTVPNDGAICLLCGTIVCFQSGCCADVEYNGRGECNSHTRECGGMIGLYYLIKRGTLLYLNAGNGTFYPSPYLDVHGEADLSMRRGRRQYLHYPRYEEVRKVWLNHGIPTIVARKLESTLDSGGWETL